MSRDFDWATGQPGRPDLRPRQARLAQRPLHPRARGRRARLPAAALPRAPTACFGETPVAGRAGPARGGRRADPDPDGPADRGAARSCAPFFVADDQLEIADDARAQLKDDARRGARRGDQGARATSTTTARGARLRERLDRRGHRGGAARGDRRRAGHQAASSPSARCAPPCPGARISPPLFESMEILGKTSTLSRLRSLRDSL